MTDTNARPILLVIEDDEGLQRQLKWAYEAYQVVSAVNREQAIDALRAHEPAVVTLDLGLPPDPDGTSEGFAVSPDGAHWTKLKTEAENAGSCASLVSSSARKPQEPQRKTL